MQNIKLNEQISFLRKQKGITQEELAKSLGVTNQSVSKWESGLSCPDIQLLPDIAIYFDVSIDELLGFRPADSFNSVYLKVKSLFQANPKEEVFSLAFKLATLLHEGAITQGYKGYVPWNTDKNYGTTLDCYQWGFSACSEPEGITVHRANAVFIVDNKITQPITNTKIREIYSFLESLCNKNTLKVLFGLYELTLRDFDLYVSVDQILEYCKLSKEAVQDALDNLPIQTKDTTDGQTLYRIEGCYMHVPSILLMFRD